MRDDGDRLAEREAGGDEGLPERLESYDHVFQALAADRGGVELVEAVAGYDAVARVVALPPRRVLGDLGRTHVVAAAIGRKQLIAVALTHGGTRLSLE